MTETTTDQSAGKLRHRTNYAVRVLGAFQKCHKGSLNDWFLETTGKKQFSNNVLLTFGLFLNKATNSGTKDPEKPNAYIDRNYTSDVIGEWLGRQATTTRGYINILRKLRWLETTEDLEGHKGWVRFDLFPERAIAFFEMLGARSIADIKAIRRSSSQKSNIDGRRNATNKNDYLPPDWKKFAKDRASSTDELAHWEGILRTLYSQGNDFDHIELIANSTKDEQLGPFDFLDRVVSERAKFLQTRDKTAKFGFEVVYNATIDNLRTEDTE